MNKSTIPNDQAHRIWKILATFAGFERWSEASSKHQGCGFPLAARSDQEVEDVSNPLANKSNWLVYKTQQSVFSVFTSLKILIKKGSRWTDALQKCDDEARYHSAVGEIMFASTHTRPDLVRKATRRIKRPPSTWPDDGYIQIRLFV